MNHCRRFNDQAKKVKIARPFLIAQTGGLFELYRVESKSATSKTISKYFGHSFWKEASAAALFRHENITDQAVAKKLGDEACKAYEEQADLLKSPWRLRQKDYVCSVAFIKASKNAEKIECMQVFLGARDHEDGSHEILVKDTSCFTVAKHDTFCKLLGLNKSRAQNLSPALKRPPESAAEAVKWAENEILTTGLTWQGVGSNVDEYLICFDGTIRRLVSNKKLAK